MLITTPSECATLKGQCEWQADIKYQSNLLLNRHTHSEGGPLLLSSRVNLFKSKVIMSHADDVYFEDATKREQSQYLREHCSESDKNYRGFVALNGIEVIVQKNGVQ